MILYRLMEFSLYLKIRQFLKKNEQQYIYIKQCKNNDWLSFFRIYWIYLSSTFDVFRVKELKVICKSFKSANSAKRARRYEIFKSEFIRN